MVSAGTAMILVLVFTLDRGVTTKNKWTFIISKQGKVLYKNDKVNAETVK